MANTGTMIEAPNGAKLKVKKESCFFGGKLTLTKNGWVVEPRPYTMLEGFYASEYEAEEALVEWLRERNLKRATSAQSLKYPNVGCGMRDTLRSTCLSLGEIRGFRIVVLGQPHLVSQELIDQALQGKAIDQLAFAGVGSNDRDGGQAVAVRVDTLGKPVEYLSFSDYIVRGFELPEGDWHYFV